MKCTLIESFLLFKPFRRLPLGSLDSEVRGLPFFIGSLTISMENATFAASQEKHNKKLNQRHLPSTATVKGIDAGSMLVLGRL